MTAKKGVTFLRGLYPRVCEAAGKQPNWQILLRELLHVEMTAENG